MKRITYSLAFLMIAVTAVKAQTLKLLRLTAKLLPSWMSAANG